MDSDGVGLHFSSGSIDSAEIEVLAGDVEQRTDRGTPDRLMSLNFIDFLPDFIECDWESQ